MRRILGVLAALVLCAPVAVLASPAQAAGACTSDKGVTVVVDYGSLGGGIDVRCAANANGSGLSALQSAGFSAQGTVKDGPGFVCRINGKPSAAREKCQATPPTSAHWVYWHASNGGAWAISQSGAANRRVTPGGFEGWSFSAGPPGVAPRRAGASGPPKAGGSRESDGSGDSADSGESGQRSSPDAKTKRREAVLKNPTSSKGSELPQPKPRVKKTAQSSSATESAETPKATSQSTKTSADDGGSSATPWIAGAIMLVLAAAIVATQLRRKRNAA